MESDELGGSIEYEEQFEDESSEIHDPAAAACSQPAAITAPEGTTLTDAELDAFLEDEEPAPSATRGSVRQPAVPEAHLVRDSTPLQRHSRQSDASSLSSQHGRVRITATQRASAAADAINEAVRLSDSASEQGYSVKFDEGTTGPSSAHPAAAATGEHVQQYPAPTDGELEESVLSADSSREVADAAPASGPASHHTSAATSRDSSAATSRRSSAAAIYAANGDSRSSNSGIAASQHDRSSMLPAQNSAAQTDVSGGRGGSFRASATSSEGCQQSGPSSTYDTEPLQQAATMEYQLQNSAATGQAYPAIVRRNSSARQRPSSAGVIKQCSSKSQQQQVQELGRSNSLQPQQQEQQHEWPQQQQEVDLLPIAKWQVRDVCDWVEGIGLSQYRKKLMHHCIDGRLLTRLTDDLLKTDIGIGPLGHRFMLLEAVQAIQSADLAEAAVGFLPDDCSELTAAALRAAARVAAAAVHMTGPRDNSNAGGKGQWGGRYTEAADATACNGGYRLGAFGSPERGRPSSAPVGGRGRSCSPRAGSPGALGPAAGRISLYEQRAKLLFELSRAQARAAAQSSAAAQVGDVARIAADDVARLKGQLADLDRKNRLQVGHSSGSVDTRGQIPWQHSGAGTKAAHPHPESFAKPWDPPDADLTFQPKISRKSQMIMADTRGAAGGSGFLDRLKNDLRRREQKQKELVQRYHGSLDPNEAAAATKSAAADLKFVADTLGHRGWATIPTGSNNDMGHQQEIDEQLDEIVESYSKELSITDAQGQAMRAARGAKKVSLLAAALRTCQFMDRYKADLATRDNRLHELQNRWFNQQMVTGVARPGAALPMTQEQRDMASAVNWFKGLGWDDAAEDDDCDDLLSALIKRARAYKTEAEKLHDKAQAGGAPASGRQAAAAQRKPNIDWQSPPWSSDRLTPLMQKYLTARKSASDAARSPPAAQRPSSANKAQQAAGSPTAISGLKGGDISSICPLDHAAQLLAGMTWHSLDQLDSATGAAKKLAVYKALRTQSFLDFTAADIAAREAKLKATWEAIEASRRGKQVSKQELDDFYVRLQEDGERRKLELEKAKADQADREGKLLALLKANAASAASRSSRSRPKSASAVAK